MPTLRERVVKLEGRAGRVDGKIRDVRAQVRDLQEWTMDEKRLREIDAQRIALLEAAKLIHDRQIGRLRRRQMGQGRR